MGPGRASKGVQLFEVSRVQVCGRFEGRVGRLFQRPVGAQVTAGQRPAAQERLTDALDQGQPETGMGRVRGVARNRRHCCRYRLPGRVPESPLTRRPVAVRCGARTHCRIPCHASFHTGCSPCIESIALLIVTMTINHISDGLAHEYWSGSGPQSLRNHVRIFRFRLCHFGDGREEWR